MKSFTTTLFFLSLLGCSQGSILMIEGKVSVKGYAHHNYLAIEDKVSHVTYHIKNGNDFNLTNRQYENIKIKIKVLKGTTGAGFPSLVEILKICDSKI